MNVHPVAQLFPMLPSKELDEMVESIKQEGLINPCVRQGDTLLDGRNRLAACEKAGVEPRFIEYAGDSPVAFIIGANLSRRHLDKGQKIAMALEIEPHFAAEAKKRMEAGRNQYSPVENVPQGTGQKSRDQAAAAVGVSGYFRWGRKISPITRNSNAEGKAACCLRKLYLKQKANPVTKPQRLLVFLASWFRRQRQSEKPIQNDSKGSGNRDSKFALTPQN